MKIQKRKKKKNKKLSITSPTIPLSSLKATRFPERVPRDLGVPYDNYKGYSVSSNTAYDMIAFPTFLTSIVLRKFQQQKIHLVLAEGRVSMWLLIGLTDEFYCPSMTEKNIRCPYSVTFCSFVTTNHCPPIFLLMHTPKNKYKYRLNAVSDLRIHYSAVRHMARF